jgi:hemolysin III
MTGEDLLTGHPLPTAQRKVSEETVNQITHGAGFLLSVIGSIVLCRYVWLYGDRWQITGCTIYSVTLMALYAASTLSHSFERASTRHFWRTVDQVCIFLLIAGTYTPFALHFIHEGIFMALLAAIWLMALAGIYVKIFHAKLKNVTTAAYVILGWLPILAIRPILERVPLAAFAWILAGGVLYTVGTLFLTHDEKVPYFHGVWHLMVISASVCHYLAILIYVAGWQP